MGVKPAGFELWSGPWGGLDPVGERPSGHCSGRRDLPGHQGASESPLELVVFVGGGHLLPVLSSLDHAGVATGVVLSRSGVLDATGFRATGWTVDYLATADWVFAAMSVVGLVFYIDSRQRQRGSA